MKSKNGHRSLAVAVLIAVLLALLGLYSYSAGYRLGGDIARNHDRN